MIKQKLLHVSGLTGPSPGNTKFTKSYKCNYSEEDRQIY